MKHEKSLSCFGCGELLFSSWFCSKTATFVCIQRFDEAETRRLGLFWLNKAELRLVGSLGFAPAPQWRHLPQTLFSLFQISFHLVEKCGCGKILSQETLTCPSQETLIKKFKSSRPALIYQGRTQSITR